MIHQTSVQWRLTGFAALATILTSLSLTPTVVDGGWGGRIVLGVLTVALAGAAARQLTIPRPFIPVVQLAALTLFLTASFGGSVAVAGAVPGPAVWQHFSALLRDGLTVTWEEASPVSATEGVAFLLVAGVAGIALAVDALAVTWRRPTLAGLPLFVLYLVPAAVLPEGVPWPLFVLAGLGWVLLQLADGRDRLSRWGKLIGSRSEVTGGTHGVGGTGRRLGATALAVAVVIPLVLPSLDESVFGSGAGDGAGAGGGGSTPGLRTVTTINPIVDLRRNLVQGDDELVFTYTTDDPTPQYLRIATLDQFDGTSWTLEEMEAGEDQQAADGLPSPPGLVEEVSRTLVTTDFQVLALNTPRLPLPYPATNVNITGDWRWDADTFDVFSVEEDGTAQGAAYTATSLDVAPTASQLIAAPAPNSNMDPYLEMPDPVRAFLQAPTSQVVASETSRYGMALAIQNWFRQDFTYSLDTPRGNETSDLEAFVTDRSGYCEQFAATMALMARVAGIPSRVQVGFTPGTQQSDGTWEVTAHDAHAWPELWFERAGWVRFEPTPGGGDGNATPGWAPPPAPAAIKPGDAGSGSGRRGDLPNLRRNPTGTPADDRRVPANPGGSRGTDAASSGSLKNTGTADSGSWAPYLLALLLVGGLMAIAPAVTRRYEHRRRWARVTDEQDAVRAAWLDVLATATDLDLAPKPTETTRDLARRLPQQGGLSRATAARLGELALAVEQARYAGRSSRVPQPSVSALNGGTQVMAWRTVADDVCSELFGAVSARDRRQAKWWPASGRAAVTARWTKQSARLDRAWGAFTAGLARRLRRA